MGCTYSKNVLAKTDRLLINSAEVAQKPMLDRQRQLAHQIRKSTANLIHTLKHCNLEARFLFAVDTAREYTLASYAPS